MSLLVHHDDDIGDHLCTVKPKSPGRCCSDRCGGFLFTFFYKVLGTIMKLPVWWSIQTGSLGDLS